MTPAPAVALIALAVVASGGPQPSLQADDLQGAVGALVQDLDLQARPLAPHEAVAVAVRTAGGDADVEMVRVVLGLLVAALSDPDTSPIVVGSGGGQSPERLDADARRAGAEWLLLTTVEQIEPAHLVLRTELRAIDRGLWTPPPDPVPIERFASHRLGVSPKIETLLTAPPARTAGRPRRLSHIDDTVLALVACDIDHLASDEVLALGVDSLTVLFAGDGRVAQTATLPLGALPRSAQPVREPIGGLVCADLDGDGDVEIAFGHSGLATGHVFRLRGTAFTRARELDGVPLGVIEGALILGKPDAGTNRWIPRLGASVGPPVLELAAWGDGPAGRRIIAVTPAYTLHHLSDELRAGPVIGTSGVGIGWVPSHGGAALIAATSSVAEAGDALRLIGSRTQTIELPAPSHASTAAAWSSPDAAELVVALRRRRGTELQLVPLEAHR